MPYDVQPLIQDVSTNNNYLLGRSPGRTGSGRARAGEEGQWWHWWQRGEACGRWGRSGTRRWRGRSRRTCGGRGRWRSGGSPWWWPRRGSQSRSGHARPCRRRRTGVAGDGAAEAGEVDGREGLDGAAHHEVEEARVGAVERGGGVAGRFLRPLVGEGGGGARGDGDGEAEERDEEEEQEEERRGGVNGGGEEGPAPRQRAARVHRGHPRAATATRTQSA